ncbi:MAG: FISUMP domain-containing protein [Bacteroidales bacterium]
MKTQAQTVSDIDGNVYNTITIGTQVWMKENLKVTHYSNGDAIPNISDNTSWSNLATGARCYYNNDSAVNAPVYGVLYNWYAVNDSRNIAPTGWHVPTDAEWTTLTTYLGGESVAGGKLKETDTTHWQSPNTGATNETGFTALPSSFRGDNGIFGYVGVYGYWWSSTEYNAIYAWFRDVHYNVSSVGRSYYDKEVGYSLRCMKNNGSDIEDINYQKKLYIYPNPVIDRVYIDCAERQDLKMQIYNVVGECVLQRALNSGTDDIDVSSLSKGIYVIQITGADWTVQRKLTKE